MRRRKQARIEKHQKMPSPFNLLQGDTRSKGDDKSNTAQKY